MTKAPRSKRDKYSLLKDLTLADWTPAMFELASRSGIGQALKEIADKDGTTVEVILHGWIADGYHKQGIPLPPDLREKLMTQPMPHAVRERHLKPHLS